MVGMLVVINYEIVLIQEKEKQQQKCGIVFKKYIMQLN